MREGAKVQCLVEPYQEDFEAGLEKSQQRNGIEIHLSYGTYESKYLVDSLNFNLDTFIGVTEIMVVYNFTSNYK